MQRALLIAAALVGIATAQVTPSGSHPTPDPAVESAMTATCNAMEGFWNGLSAACAAGVQSAMRQPTVKISDIKAQVTSYVASTCPASSANLTALEAAINNSITVATNSVQQSTQLSAEAKALIVNMMTTAQNQDLTPIGVCAAEINILKNADPNVSEAIIRHMMMNHRKGGGHHGGPGGAGSSEAAGGSTVAGGSPPTPPSGSPPSWAGSGSGGPGGMSGGVAGWLKNVDATSFCTDKMNKMASSTGGGSGGAPHFPMCGGHDDIVHNTGGSNVMAAAKQHAGQ